MIWMILRQALVLILSGVAIGVPAALGAAKFATSRISGLFFGLKPSDPIAISAATLLLALVTMVAGYLPARRASRVDPMAALRNE